MIRRARTVPPAERERGAITVLVGISMVAMLVMAALVIDLGFVQTRKRQIQNVVDTAALAAGYHLAGHGNSFVLSDPRGACSAAVRAVKRNLSRFPVAASFNCGAFPASGTAPDCTSSSAMQTISSVGGGRVTLRISYPVPATVIQDNRFAGGVGASDGYRCDRMKVEVSEAGSSFFGRLVRSTAIGVQASAVVRGSVNITDGGVPAFLLLDRSGCAVLTTSASGAGNYGIVVRAVSATEGGHIHADTDASECGGNSTDYAIYSTPLSGGATSVTVANGSSGDLGTISVYATAAGSLRGGATYPGGLSHPATAGPVASRRPFDEAFNQTNGTQISNLHATAWSAVTMNVIEAAANGYLVVPCGVDGTISSQKIFVACSNYSPTSAFFPNAHTVVFSGKVSVTAGHTLNMPNANRVYVRGCPSCSGANFASLDIAGGWYQNIGNNATPSADCNDRLGPGAGGSNTNTSVLVTFGSPIIISGKARICETFVYMARNNATYARLASVSGAPNCSQALPCPVRTGGDAGGYYQISGDKTQIFSQNQGTLGPSSSNPFEDLAMWSESPGLDQVKSGGVFETAGIFFTPNSPVEMRSPAVGSPRRAQFVARTMAALQGTMDVQPIPSDAIEVPLPGGYGLIR